MPLVWERPNGELVVMVMSDKFLEANRQPGESTADLVLRLAPGEQAKTVGLAENSLVGAKPVLVKSTDMPALPDRGDRDRWRLVNGRVQIDAAVPQRPPKRV